MQADKPKNQLSDQLITHLPLMWISLGFVGGILLASQLVLFVNKTWFILAGAAFTLAVLIGVLRIRFKSLPLYLILIPLFLAALSMGTARYQALQPTIDSFHIAWYNDREYEMLVTGTIAEPPDERDTYTNLRVQVEKIDTGDGKELPVHGLMLVRTLPGINLRYGDVVRLRGYLKTPPEDEDFSYRDYLARQGIYGYMANAEVTKLPLYNGKPVMAAIYTFKEYAIDHLYHLFPDPEASLLAGILLGNDNGLSADLQQAFKNTGTAHIIAISGFNITIIAGLFVTVFSRLLGTRRGAVAAVIGITIYTILVGAEASVVRSAIMGGLALLARQVGRRQFGLNTLACTAAIMCALNPYIPWDVGFQLSFGATLGLVLYAQPFQDWAVKLISRSSSPNAAEKIAKPLAAYFLFTLAAQLTALPIMAYHFKRISLVSLIANPFILPAQPPVMLLGGLALLLSFAWPPLGQLVAYLAWPFPAYTIRAVEWFNRLPHGVIVLGDFSIWLVILFYTVLLAATFSTGRVKEKLRAALAPSFIIAALGIVVFLVWSAIFKIPDGRLHITFVDVGSSNAVLIQTPSGHAVLVNGGPSPSKLSDALGRRLSLFNRRLDWLVIASTQEEQMAALPRILDRFPPAAALWAGKSEASYSAGQVEQWLAENNVLVTQATSGGGLDLGSGCRLEVLNITPRGAILLVSLGNFRALLPIGANFDSLAELENGAKVGAVSVLLLGDSGYAPLNPPEWIETLRPQVIILSVAAGDPNGLPSQATLGAVEGFTLLRTDRNGWIDISTDGSQMWIETERKP